MPLPVMDPVMIGQHNHIFAADRLSASRANTNGCRLGNAPYATAIQVLATRAARHRRADSRRAVGLPPLPGKATPTFVPYFSYCNGKHHVGTAEIESSLVLLLRH
jgi:hypothetical protein